MSFNGNFTSVRVQYTGLRIRRSCVDNLDVNHVRGRFQRGNIENDLDVSSTALYQGCDFRKATNILANLRIFPMSKSETCFPESRTFAVVVIVVEDAFDKIFVLLSCADIAFLMRTCHQLRQTSYLPPFHNFHH